MKTFKLTLRPLTPFGTPLAGDTIFGHLCWALRERHGEQALEQALQGYTEGRPFLVVSDAFPSGCVPRPSVPDFRLGITVDPARRKLARELKWLPSDGAGLPLQTWLGRAVKTPAAGKVVVTQNTINRITATTGSGIFAPRQVDRDVYPQGARLDLYLVLDENRLDRDSCRQLFDDVGAAGYGRDATAGLGKFAVEDVAEHVWPATPSRHWLTLAPCAPDCAQLDAEECYYQPLVRFGRHGNIAVRLGAPFKRPLLLIDTGALLATRQQTTLTYHGKGLGGRSSPLSFAIDATVHQGYAPLVPLTLERPQ